MKSISREDIASALAALIENGLCSVEEKTQALLRRARDAETGEAPLTFTKPFSIRLFRIRWMELGFQSLISISANISGLESARPAFQSTCITASSFGDKYRFFNSAAPFSVKVFTSVKYNLSIHNIKRLVNSIIYS